MGCSLRDEAKAKVQPEQEIKPDFYRLWNRQTCFLANILAFLPPTINLSVLWKV